jgi:hypothetical protein
MSRKDANKTATLAAMLTYNLLVMTYLMYLGLGGTGRNTSMATIHAVLTVLVAYVWSVINSRSNRIPDSASAQRPLPAEC